MKERERKEIMMDRSDKKLKDEKVQSLERVEGGKCCRMTCNTLFNRVHD